MPKLTLPSFVGTVSPTQLNTWKSLLEAVVEDQLSRSGQVPNSMEQDVDLRSNDIINVNMLSAQLVSANDIIIDGISPLTLLQDVSLATGAAAQSATQAYASASTASSAANAAEQARDAAEDAEVQTGEDRIKAEQWAQNPEDVEVETGQYSALHWAAKAANGGSSPGDPGHELAYDHDAYDAHVASTSNPHGVTAVQAGAEPANANIQTHIGSTDNPHSVTKTHVGLDNVTNDTQLKVASNLSDVANVGTSRANLDLGNVDNTSDSAKPVSTAQQTALNLKANLASPTFTGTPLAPTAANGTDTTQIATTAFVYNQIGAMTSGVSSVTGTAPITVTGTSSQPVVGVDAATTSAAGSMSSDDKSKLNGIAAGAQVNVATNLGSSGTGATRTITSSTGTNTSITYSSADVGAAAASHTHTLAHITNSGNLAAINTNASTVNYLRGDGAWVTPPNTNTTYSAGNGLTLSGTVFSLPVATSGTGTFVTSITQTTGGITANLGTPPNTNTTYSAGTGITFSGTTINNAAPHVATNLGSSGTGATRAITSSTGTDTSITYSAADLGLGNVTNNAQLKVASNLSDVANVGTSRANLGLGTLAIQAANAVAITGGTASVSTVAVTSTADATSTLVAPLKSAGGLAVAKKAYFGDDVNFANVETQQFRSLSLVLGIPADGSWNKFFTVPLGSAWTVIASYYRHDESVSAGSEMTVIRGLLAANAAATTIVIAAGVQLRLNGNDVEFNRTVGGGGSRNVSVAAMRMI